MSSAAFAAVVMSALRSDTRDFRKQHIHGSDITLCDPDQSLYFVLTTGISKKETTKHSGHPVYATRVCNSVK